MSKKTDHYDAEYVEAEVVTDSYEQLKRKQKQMKAAARKIETPGMVCASLFGALGLVAGIGGMIIALRDEMAVGLAITAVGAVLGVLAFPVYLLISHRRRKDYFEKNLYSRK